MGLWNLYFLAKIYLFHTGQMQPIWLLNLVFALLLAAMRRTGSRKGEPRA